MESVLGIAAPTDPELVCEANDSAINEIKYQLNYLASCISENVNRIIGILTIAGLIPAFTLDYTNIKFVQQFLVWSLPFLLISVSFFFLAFINRKFIVTRDLPIVAGNLSIKMEVSSKILDFYRNIWTKTINEFYKILFYHNQTIIFAILFIFSYLIQLYFFNFSIELRLLEKLLLMFNILLIGLCLNLYKKAQKSSFKKTYEIKPQ